MTNRCMLGVALLAALLVPPAIRADPLHRVADDAYWHHESNFIFPATLAGFVRVGAPQEVDGSTTVIAHYALGDGAARIVAVITVFPAPDDPASAAADSGKGSFVRILEQAGWRVVVRSSLADETTEGRLDTLVRGLRLERLGEIDTRCPNAGCGSPFPE